MKAIKWNLHPVSLAVGRRSKRLALDYLPFLYCHLDEGPQHKDLAVQSLLRPCYFRWSFTEGEELTCAVDPVGCRSAARKGEP
jgi:hypothetical protein